MKTGIVYFDQEGTWLDWIVGIAVLVFVIVCFYRFIMGHVSFTDFFLYGIAIALLFGYIVIPICIGAIYKHL